MKEKHYHKSRGEVSQRRYAELRRKCMNINPNNILHETTGEAEAKLVLGKDIGAFSAHSKLSAAPQQRMPACRGFLSSASDTLRKSLTSSSRQLRCPSVTTKQVTAL